MTTTASRVATKGPTRKPAIEGWVVYRHFDAKGVLMYVGMTRRPKEREYSHRAYSRWHPLSARRTEEWFATIGEAERAEKVAIETEGPVFNWEHNDGNYYRRMSAFLNITFPDDAIQRMYFVDRLVRRGPIVRYPRRRTWKTLERAWK